MTALDLVFNPVSGSFDEGHLAALVAALEREGFAVTPRPTRREGAQLSGDAELVCVHGGDGTLRDTVRALGEDAGRVPQCIAPSGTINLVARELGYPREPTAFARQIAAAWARGPQNWVHSPLYRLGRLPVVSCLSIAPDSAAVARVSSGLKVRVGRYAYAAAMFGLLRDWPRGTMHLQGELADGTPFSDTVEALFVSRAAYYAGPFRLSPRAALEAETVELITLRRATRLTTLAFSMSAALHRPMVPAGLADIRSVRRFEIEGATLPVQADGDPVSDPAMTFGPDGLTLRYVV